MWLKSSHITDGRMSKSLEQTTGHNMLEPAPPPPLNQSPQLHFFGEIAPQDPVNLHIPLSLVLDLLLSYIK